MVMLCGEEKKAGGRSFGGFSLRNSQMDMLGRIEWQFEISVWAILYFYRSGSEIVD